LAAEPPFTIGHERGKNRDVQDSVAIGEKLMMRHGINSDVRSYKLLLRQNDFPLNRLIYRIHLA
jgi:hypothetical protein